MIQSSLFKKLHEGAGSSRGSDFQNKVAAKLDKEEAAKKRLEKGIKPKEDTTPTPHRGEQIEKGDLEATSSELKASSSLYVQDKMGVEDLLGELDTLPFQYGGPRIKVLLTAIKNMMFDSRFEEIHTALQKAQNPALTETASLFEYSGPISIVNTKPLEPQLQPVPSFVISSKDSALDSNSYAAIVGFVFPFLDRDLLNSIISTYSNITNVLNNYANAYTGTIINKIDWAAGENIPDFSTFEHISDTSVKEFLKYVRDSIVREGTAEIFNPRLVKLAKRGEVDATSGLKKSLSGSVANNKHLANVVNNIYYSLVTRALPFNADLLELNNQETKKVSDNPDTADISNVLTDNAQTLIASRIIDVEKNPYLYKGIVGQNSKTQLAFDYAKKVVFKQNKNTKINEKTTDIVAKLFDNALKRIPGMAQQFERLAGIFDSYFVNDAGNEFNAERLKAELDAYATESESLISSGLSDENYAQLFRQMLISYPELKDSNTDVKSVVDTYVKPFIDTLVERFAIIKDITVEDIKAVHNIGEACTQFLAGQITKKDIKTALEVFKNYDTSKASSGQDEGYKFLRSISKTQNLVQQANKKYKKVATKETEVKQNKTSVEKSVIQHQAIRNARKKILDSKHLLQTLPSKVTSLLLEIKNKLHNLDTRTLKAVVSGNYEDIDETEVDNFLTTLTSSLYDTYFGPSNLGLLSELPDDIDENRAESAIIKKYVASDIVEKAKNGLLIAPGSLKKFSNTYPGLTESFIDFINLAASIKEGYSGITTSPDGEIKFNFELEGSSLKEGFFTKFFFGNLTTKVSAEPVISLAAQRTMLKRMQTPLQTLMNETSMSTFILPSVEKEQPKLAMQIRDYLNEIKHVAVVGIPEAISSIDAEILGQKSGQYVTIVDQNPTTRGTASMDHKSYYIPSTLDEAYEKNVTLIGSIALRLLSNVPGANTASKEFFRQLVMTSETIGSEVMYEYFSHAIDIISAAINVDIARQALYGDEAQLQAVAALVRKYQKDNNIEGLNNIKIAKQTAEEYVNAFHSATAKKVRNKETGEQVPQMDTGAVGTNILTGKDNHIDNHILGMVLRKFNAFISKDSWATMYMKHKEQSGKEQEELTADYSNIHLIIQKLGIAYRRIGNFASFAEAVDPELAISEAEEPEDSTTEATIPNQGYLVASNNGPKANLEGMRQIIKNLEDKLVGVERTPLRKGQAQGQQYQYITSMNELFNKSEMAMHRAVETVGSYLVSAGDSNSANLLATEIERAKENFEIMKRFFAAINQARTLDNLPIQTSLLNILAELKAPNYSDLFVELFLNTPDTRSRAFSNRLTSTFRVKRELPAVYELLKDGKSLEEIKRLVAEELKSIAASSDEDYKAKFNALADIEYQPEAPATTEPVQPVKPLKAPAFIKELSSNPIPSHELNKKKEEYTKRVATLLDPETYKAVTPEEGAALKKYAVNIINRGTASDPKSVAYFTAFNKTIQDTIAAGNTVNKITGQPVKSQLAPNQLFESVKLFLAALFEAELSPQEPTNQSEGTEINEEPPVDVNVDTLYRRIASTLLRLGVVETQVAQTSQATKDEEGNEIAPNEYTVSKLMNPDGSEFTRWADAYWMLFATNSKFSEDTKLVNKLFKSKDELEFRTLKGVKYAKVTDFDAIQNLILVNRVESTEG